MHRTIFVGSRPWLNDWIGRLTVGFVHDYIYKRAGAHIIHIEHKDQTVEYYFLSPQREMLQGYQAAEWIIQDGLPQEIQDEVNIRRQIGQLDKKIYDNIKAHGKVRLELPKKTECTCDIKHLMDVGHYETCPYKRGQE